MHDIARKGQRPEAINAAITEFFGAFGNRVVTSRAVCEQHAHTTTWLPTEPPNAVFYPQTTEDVQQAVGICGRHRVPIVAFGAGTSLEGALNAPLGGISCDLKDMNRIIAVHSPDFDCVVEPGVTRHQLNDYLRDQGLFFSVVPRRRRLAWGHGVNPCYQAPPPSDMAP